MKHPLSAALLSAVLFALFTGARASADETRFDFTAEVRIELFGRVDLPLEDWQVILMDGRTRLGKGILRKEGRVFVGQFPALRGRLEKDVTLAVQDEHGYRFGACPLRPGWHESSTPIPMEVRATGRVRSEIEWEPVPPHLEEDWSPDNRSISITRVGESADETDRYRVPRWKWLEPGTYLARSGSRDYRWFEQEFQVFPGQVSVMRGRMSLEDQPRVVRGEAWSEDGSKLGGFLLALKDPVDTRNSWTVAQPYDRGPWEDCGSNGRSRDAWVSMLEGSSSHGSFLLPRVCSADLEVDLLSCEVPMRAELLELPDGTLQLNVVQLDPSGPGIGFRTPPGSPGIGPFEDRSFSAELDWRLTTRVRDGGPPISGFAAEGVPCARVDPREREFDWALDACGFKPIYGDQFSFTEEAPGRFFATVTPEKGTSVRVLAIDSAGTPVTGAVVTSAGVELGTTNDQAWLDVEDLWREIQAHDEEGRTSTSSRPGLEGFELFYGVPRSAPWFEVVLE